MLVCSPEATPWAKVFILTAPASLPFTDNEMANKLIYHDSKPVIYNSQILTLLETLFAKHVQRSFIGVDLSGSLAESGPVQFESDCRYIGKC